MTTQTTAIVASDLRKSYKKVDVLKGVSFSVEKGTVLALLVVSYVLALRIYKTKTI